MDLFFISLIVSMILYNAFALPSPATKDRNKRDDYDNDFHGVGSLPLDNNVPNEFLDYLALPYEDEHEYNAYSPPVATYGVPEPSPTYGASAPSPTYGVPAPSPAYVAPAPSTTYVAPAPSTTYVAPAPSPVYVAPAPSPTYGVPAPSPTYGAPAPAPIPVPLPVPITQGAVLSPKVELFRFIEAFIQFKKELIARLQHLLNDNWDLIRAIFNLIIGKLQKLQGFTLVFISILRQIFEFAIGLFSQFNFNLPSVSVGVAGQVNPLPSLSLNVPDILSTFTGLFRG